VNVATDENGPLPVARWSAIPDQQGGELMEVLSEGGRGLGFDMSEDPVVAYWLDADSSEDPVRQVTDPWAFLDEFMAIRLERKR
jgi:hypothetical protein